jgi:hypothetical protein
MLAHHRAVAVTCVLGNLLVAEMPLAAAQKHVTRVSGPRLPAEPPKPSVHLYVYNMAPVSPALLADAESEASDVYRAAGVTIEWSDGRAGVEATQVVSSGQGPNLRVIVMGGDAELHLIKEGGLSPTALGVAPTKRQCFCGRSAYVFSDRILTIGYRHGNPTALLGRVIAHEVGHLLLSSVGHSRTGIMRGTLETEISIQPRFTKDQVKELARSIGRTQKDELFADARVEPAP